MGIFSLKNLGRVSSLFTLALVAGSGAAYAQEAAEAASTGGSSTAMWLALGSALGLGIAALGCGLGLGKAVSATMDGISRNPQAAKDMFVPMILGFAFIEALTIYALIFVFIFTAAVPL